MTVQPADLALPAPRTRPRVALLVDGDNLSAAWAGRLVMLAAKEGEAVIRRVFGAQGAFTQWQKTEGFRLIHAGAGKNAADLLICVEAMELMLTGKADVLLLASSDRDFSHLATHLRESGRRVVGVGEDGKASGHFLRCCSAHHLLKVAEPAVAPAPAPVPAVVTTPAPNAPPHVAALIALIRSAGTGGALPIQQLGAKAKAATGKTPAELGHASWRAVLTAHPRHFRCDPKGPAAQVRLV